MQTIKIGATNWEVSNVALGIMRMGTLPVAEAVKTLQAAHEAGINFIDSADIYGRDPKLGRGSSEIHFGQALKQSRLHRDDFYIQSKAGLFADETGRITRYDSSKKHLLTAVDGILERMGIDYLDSFLIHRPDPLMEPEEVAAAFDELQKAGKVRHFGVSNFNPQQIELLQQACSQRLLIDQLQFSIMHTGMIDFGLHTNMTDQASLNHDGGLLEYARRKQMTIQTWSPFQYGTFAGTFIDNEEFHELNVVLKQLADKYHVSKNAIAVAWILKHLDAGKTTLSEALLYQTGIIRRLGRVDNGDAFLDSDQLEKKRGITIFSHQAKLEYDDLSITLLDTPGHVDFAAQTEQALQVLDYAVLVISATDGVKGYTRTLWQLLTENRVPTFIFINKMDADTADGQAVLSQLQTELAPGCFALTDFNGNLKPFDHEELAMQDDDALLEYLDQGRLSDERIRQMIQHRQLFPCCFGSALKLQGIDALLASLAQWTQPREFPSEFAARVFKISHDERGERLTWVRVMGGSLKAKTAILPDQKANQLRVYNGSKFTIVNQVASGATCAIAGPTTTYPGQGLGKLKDDTQTLMQPVLSYAVDPKENDVHQCLKAMQTLADEDPLLHVVWNEQLQEIRVQIMGTVQLEIMQQLLLERFDIDVDFIKGGILYRETITAPIEGVGHFEPLRHYAEAHLLLEPAKRGAGMRYASQCSIDVLNKNWQHQIITSLEQTSPKGVLIGAPLTDVKVTLVGGRAHVKHTEGGDFRQAASRALRQGLMTLKARQQCQLLEPWYRFRLIVPSTQVGRALNDLQRMHGEVDPLGDQTTDSVLLTGLAPVAQMSDYATVLRGYTHGQGQLECLPAGYRPCHNADEIIQQADYLPTADLANTPDSVFCAHGAGYPVKWDQVPQTMHCDYYCDFMHV